MPQTKFQEFIFTLLMTFIMVYAMICYNIALTQGGMSNAIFILAFHELIYMWPIAILAEMFVVGKLAHRLAFRLLSPEMRNSLTIMLAISVMTVCLMCPIMSLIATILIQHTSEQLIAVWLQMIIINFPMAFCWQLFLAGPVVRFVFRTLFKRQLSTKKAAIPNGVSA